ncbi:MAG: efflux family protein [Myxococcaceae bacterium]|nr:efflux family protein [Myxococcaceae bacterium]
MASPSTRAHDVTQARLPARTLRSLLTLAWPVILARATQSVIGFVDTLMVAPLGEDALAATTTGGLNFFAFIIFPMGTVFIVQSFTAQLRGRGELEAVPRYAFYGLILAAFSGVLGLLSVPFLPRLLGLLSYSPKVESLIFDYLAIRLLSVAPAIGVEALGNWYGGLGNTRPAMVAGVVAMGVNVAGCWLLIEPRLGLPGFGVAGSAAAGALGTWLGFFVIARRFWRDRRALALTRPRALRLSELLRMLRFGVPNGINWFLEIGAFALFINLVVGHLGTTVLAAFNVVLQFNSLAFMPAFGLASAGAILVGESIGARDKERVWPSVKLTLQVACSWMSGVALLYIGFGVQLLRWFQPPDVSAARFATIASTMLVWSAFWQLFDAVGITLSETLRAAGDTTWGMFARIVLGWVFFMPLAWAWVIRWDGGVFAVMGALVAYVAAIALVLAARFGSGKWKSIDLVGEPALV